MRILSIDTSTSLAGIVLADNDRMLAESRFNCDRTLSSRLIPELERVCHDSGVTLQDIDLFACCTGPGSFTGVRAGVAVIQGLSLATNTPCMGFSSLAALAMNTPFAAHPVCALLDARKGEMYVGVYDCTTGFPVPFIEETTIPPDELPRYLGAACNNPIILVGDGAMRYGDRLQQLLGDRAVIPPGLMHNNHGINGVLLIREALRGGAVPYDKPVLLQPSYLRATDREYKKINQQHSPNTA